MGKTQQPKGKQRNHLCILVTRLNIVCMGNNFMLLQCSYDAGNSLFIVKQLCLVLFLRTDSALVVKKCWHKLCRELFLGIQFPVSSLSRITLQTVLVACRNTLIISARLTIRFKYSINVEFCKQIPMQINFGRKWQCSWYHHIQDLLCTGVLFESVHYLLLHVAKKKKKAVCLTDELHALHFLYLWRAVVLNPAQIAEIKYWTWGACNH